MKYLALPNIELSGLTHDTIQRALDKFIIKYGHKPERIYLKSLYNRITLKGSFVLFNGIYTTVI